MQYKHHTGIFACDEYQAGGFLLWLGRGVSVRVRVLNSKALNP